MDKQAVNVFEVVLWRLELLEQMNELCSLFCGSESKPDAQHKDDDRQQFNAHSDDEGVEMRLPDLPLHEEGMTHRVEGPACAGREPRH